jgi:hypothetical protein
VLSSFIPAPALLAIKPRHSRHDRARVSGPRKLGAWHSAIFIGLRNMEMTILRSMAREIWLPPSATLAYELHSTPRWPGSALAFRGYTHHGESGKTPELVAVPAYRRSSRKNLRVRCDLRKRLASQSI